MTQPSSPAGTGLRPSPLPSAHAALILTTLTLVPRPSVHPKPPAHGGISSPWTQAGARSWHLTS